MKEADTFGAEGASTSDEDAREYVAARVKAGASRGAVIQELIQRGYDPQSAGDLVKPVARHESRSARKSGLTMLVVGIVLCAAGLTTTITGYQSVSATGGTYFIWYGLILLGVFLFGRGLVQLVRGRRVK